MGWNDRQPISTATDLIRQMLGQIHAVMKQADDIDGLTVRHPENHQMAAFSANLTDPTEFMGQYGLLQQYLLSARAGPSWFQKF